MPDKTVGLLINDMPEPLHRGIKVAAAEDGKALKEWVKELFAQELERREETKRSA